MARPPAPCGTFTAYKRHRRNGEPVDEACAAACAAESTARRPRGEPAAPAQQPSAAPKSRPGRDHRDAVSRMLRATGLLHVPEEALLVVTLKTLAARLDADPEDARARTQWLTAQNQLRQALNVAPGRPKSSPDVAAPAAPAAQEPQPAEEPAPVNSLAAFRQRRRIGV